MPEFEPLHPTFGVQIHGVDLTGALDDAIFAPIKGHPGPAFLPGAASPFPEVAC